MACRRWNATDLGTALLTAPGYPPPSMLAAPINSVISWFRGGICPINRSRLHLRKPSHILTPAPAARHSGNCQVSRR